MKISNLLECNFAILIIRNLRIEITNREATSCTYLKIRSDKSKGISQKNIILKLYEGNIYFYIFIRQFSQIEFFYFYQSEVGV
jgi:hypothetical protein